MSIHGLLSMSAALVQFALANAIFFQDRFNRIHRRAALFFCLTSLYFAGEFLQRTAQTAQTADLFLRAQGVLFLAVGAGMALIVEWGRLKGTARRAVQTFNWVFAVAFAVVHPFWNVLGTIHYSERYGMFTITTDALSWVGVAGYLWIVLTGVLAVGISIRTYRQAKTRAARLRNRPMLWGVMVPFMLAVAIDIFPILLGLDWPIFSSIYFTCGGLFMAWAVSQGHLFTLSIPAASRQITRSMMEGMALADEAGQIMDVNAALSQLAGVPKKQLIGRMLGAVFINLDPGVAEQAIGTQEGHRFETFVVAADGRNVAVLVTVTAVRDQGFAKGMVVTALDISRFREAERAQRLALEAAEQAVQAKDTFLATMSHEIRTPMHGMIAMASLLSETELDGRQREFLETIESSGEALLRIINDILDFSKIEAGQVVLERRAFDLRSELDQVFESVVERATTHGVELSAFVSADVPLQVVGDSARLRQVLLNLLSNAIKFADGSFARLEVRQLKSDAIEFKVEDGGIGIPAATVDQLFKPFSQADASTTRRFGGTGLGLAISQRLAECMGEPIKVKSAPGHGATFTFVCALPPGSDPTEVRPLEGQRVFVGVADERLKADIEERLWAWGAAVAEGADEALVVWDGVGEAPVSRTPSGGPIPWVLVEQPCRMRRLHQGLVRRVGQVPERPSTPLSLMDLRETRHLRVLVAEDNPINRKVAIRMLERIGLSPTLVSDGHQAVEAVDEAEAAYDVVLMDVQMPRMDGMEATRLIRAGRRNPYIIAMTANAMIGDRDRCLKAGMDAYLSKPIRPVELARALANAAKAHRLGERGEG